MTVRLSLRAPGRGDLGTGQAGGTVHGEPLHRIDGRVSRPARVIFEVQVRTGRLAGGADVSDVLAGGHAVAWPDVGVSGQFGLAIDSCQPT